MAGVRIGRGLVIPEDELSWSFSRSGGPGGQHANTSDTKAELRFAVDATRALTDAQKAAVRARLGHRLTAAGELVLTGNEHRSQTRNRAAVLARFATLLADALRPVKQRRPTRPSRAAKQRRLDGICGISGGVAASRSVSRCRWHWVATRTRSWS